MTVKTGVSIDKDYTVHGNLNTQRGDVLPKEDRR